MTTNEQIEEMAEKLHDWYLEAIESLSKGSFNPKAQVAYENLSEEQKYIDRYIAGKVLGLAKQSAEQARERRNGELLIMMDKLEKEGWNFSRFVDVFAASILQEKDKGHPIPAQEDK